MAFQHIFTSAQMGLHPGSSGYCTVAQTEGIPGDLVKALERLSTYDFSARNDPEMEGHSPLIYRYQVVQSHSGHYFVVSRISDAGADHTGRTNYLAQHLALDSSEILQLRDYPHLNPAALLLVGKPWKDAWDEMPKTLPNLTINDLFPDNDPVYEMPGKGCSTWRKGHLGTKVDQAPMLLESPLNTKCFLRLDPGQERELLKLLNETLWLSGAEAWRYSFTTFLQREESHENYAWCAVSGGNAQEQASGAGQKLCEMHSLPQASDEALKYKAENGQEEPIDPKPAPEVTQPQVLPAGPTPSPAPTPQPSLQTQPPQVTSPPSIEENQPSKEDFIRDLYAINTRARNTPDMGKQIDDAKSACCKAFRVQNENYAKYIKSQIQDSLDLKFIESERDKLDRLRSEHLAYCKGLKIMLSAKKTLMDVLTEIYEPLDEEIAAKLKKGIKPPEVAPPPPPLPANGTPEKSHWKKVIAELPRKRIFVALGLAVAFIFVLIKWDWIETNWENWKRIKNSKVTAHTNKGGGKQAGGKQDGGKQGGGKQGGGKQGGGNKGGNTTNPDNEYKTSEELKAKVDKYFGTGNAIVRLFVATNGQLTLKGNEVRELFTVLSKDQLNPKPTVGLSGSIEVYQPQSTNGFEGLKWESADPNDLASSGVELLYGRSVSGNGGISIAGVPKWLKSSGTTEIERKMDDNKIKKHMTTKFFIRVKKNTAIRVKAAGKIEIIYILYNPGIFFDGLFDEAVNKPKGRDLAKLLIDPYLMDRLNQQVLYKGTTASSLGMAVPKSVYKDSIVYLKQKNQAGREWVVRTKIFDDRINDYENPLPPQSKTIEVVPNANNPEMRKGNEFLFLIGNLYNGEFFKDSKITVTPSDKIEVTGIRSGADNNLKKEGNTFVLKKKTTQSAPFYCWVKSKKPDYLVNPKEHIEIKIELSDPQKRGLINSQVTAKKERQDAFKAVLKVDTTLFYYKPDINGARVIQFNRKN